MSSPRLRKSTASPGMPCRRWWSNRPRCKRAWRRIRMPKCVGIRARGKPYEGRNPVAYVISANVSRRQTKQTTVQKRELISRVLKESPEVSDRQVGRLTQAHHSTVSAVREEMEGCG